jgi:hypothetical protein
MAESKVEQLLSGNNEFKWDDKLKAWIPVRKSTVITPDTSSAPADSLFTLTESQLTQLEAVNEIENFYFPLEIIDERGVDSVAKDTIKIPWNVIDSYHQANLKAKQTIDPETPTLAQVKEYVTTGVITKPVGPQAYSTSYDIDEVKSSGAVEVIAEDGTESFNFLLPDATSAEGGLVSQPAVLLPDPATKKFYVDTLENAVELYSRSYVKNGKVAEIKKKLWESGYIDDASYLKSIQGSAADLPDAALRIGLATAFTETSIYNKARIDSGRRDLMDLDSHIADVYNPKILVGEEYSDVPTPGSIDAILENAYQLKQGRRPTTSEFEAFRDIVENEIMGKPSQTFQVKTPSGFSTAVTYEGFDLVDIQQLAEERANQSPGRSAYYGATNFSQGFMDAIRGEFGSGTESLEELLR